LPDPPPLASPESVAFMRTAPQRRLDRISPARALLVVALTTLLGEAICILLGEQLSSLAGLRHELLDAAVILAVTFPCLFYFFVWPMRRAIREREQAQDALEAVCQDLELKVHARTAMLESLNLSLGRSQAQYSSLVENSPTGIFILKGGRIVFGNNLFFEMLDLPKEERPDLDPAAFIHPEDLAPVQAIWKRRYSGEAAGADRDYRIVTAAGAVRWIHGRTTPFLFQEGLALLGNIQDNTERYQADKDLKESREALRLLSARLLAVQEEERKRVAQDLHDSIGQSLTAIKFMVERALKAGPRESEGAAAVLPGVIPLIQQAVEETRRICMALRPSILDDLGLIATIKWFVREFQKTYPHIQVELTIELAESLFPGELKTGFFRIIQESMNNIAKHSEAARVDIGIRWEAGYLCLTVRDDGQGFDHQKPRDSERPGGFGLASMRERAELYNGTLAIESAEGKGTTLTARWPLVEAPDFQKLFFTHVPL